MEHGFAWTGLFRRLAWGYERRRTPFDGVHFITFALLALKTALPIFALM